MKDYLNKDLQLGQLVVFTGQNGASLTKGVVSSFTAKMVRITKTYRGNPEIVIKSPENVVGMPME